MDAKHPDGDNAYDPDLYAQRKWQLSAGVNLKHDDGVEDKHWLLSHPAFNSFICIAVLVNTLLMGVEVDYPERHSLWTIIENLFTAVFSLELVIKLYFLRCAYFSERGHWLDATLVLLAVPDTWILAPLGGEADLQSLSVLRTLRILRLARVFRLFFRFERFSLILVGVTEALHTTFWVGSLVGILIFTCAIFCTEFIGRGEVELYPGYTTDATKIDEAETIALFNPYLSFGSMSSSMLTLFNVLIGAEWTEIVRPIFLKQPHFALFFLALMLLIGFGVMNVIIALIVDRVLMNTSQKEMESASEEIQARLSELAEIRRVLRTLSTDVDGRVNVAELERYMQNPDMMHLLKRVNLPKGMSAHEMPIVLDEDGDGILFHDEIVRGLYRLIDSDNFQRLCLSQMSINRVLAYVTQISRQNSETQDMVKSLSSSVSMLLAERPLTGNQNRPTQLPMRASSVAETISRKVNPAAMTVPAIPSANAGARQAVKASTRTDTCADPLAIVIAKLEAQIAQILMDEKVMDATCARSVAAVCRPNMLQEVVSRLERAKTVEHVERAVLWDGRCQSHGLSQDDLPQEELLPTPGGCTLGNYIEPTRPLMPSTASAFGDCRNEANGRLTSHSSPEAITQRRTCRPTSSCCREI